MVQKARTINAINLKSYNLSESDKIILMYSQEEGLIKCVAKGCKKPKSKLGARMDLLVANNLLISGGRNLNTICEAKTLNSFKNIRQDIDKLMYSSYIAEITSAYGVENDLCANEIYNILYKALERISDSKDKKDILNTVMKFQLKFMQIQGLGIELKTCLCCQKEVLNENMYFSHLKGGIICDNCVSDSSIKLHHKLRDFLLVLSGTDFDKTSEYEIKSTEKVCMVCFNLLKQYIQTHSSKKLKTTGLLEAV